MSTKPNFLSEKMKASSFGPRLTTSIFLVLGAALWMFIGSAYLETFAGSLPQWSAYSFLAINSLLYLVCIWEIMNLRKALEWPLLVKITIMFLGLLILWFPSGFEHYAPYNHFTNIFKPWMFLIVIVGLGALFFLIPFISSSFNNEDATFSLVWTIYFVIVFKGIDYLMLNKGGTNTVPIPMGWASVLMVMVLVMANDTGAYLGGVSFGKTPLAPKISPKKTWEGVACGIVISEVITLSLVAILIEVVHRNPLPIFYGNISHWMVYVIYAMVIFVLIVVAVLGDLLFSLLKRLHNTKDFSRIFPGHGGMLDRFDSFSAAIIVTYLMALAITASLS